MSNENNFMIYSMTAFARSQSQHNEGNFICEIRTINHRYLEVSVYLPDILRALEMPVRDCIRSTIKRGKIECSIRYKPQATDALATINVDMAQQLCHAGEQIAVLLKQAAPIQPCDILRFPGVLETKEADVEKLQKPILQLVEKTLKEVMIVRGREGEELKKLFLQRMDLLKQELIKVRMQFPQVIQEQRARLLKRFNDVKLELDPLRLEQEMVIYAQRMDVSEEMDRIETHINEVKRVLQQDDAVGRRLDFLLQELNREANTLGSKSTDSILTHAAVEMKVLIEQVREQVQNIE